MSEKKLSERLRSGFGESTVEVSVADMAVLITEIEKLEANPFGGVDWAGPNEDEVHELRKSEQQLADKVRQVLEENAELRTERTHRQVAESKLRNALAAVEVERDGLKGELANRGAEALRRKRLFDDLIEERDAAKKRIHALESSEQWAVTRKGMNKDAAEYVSRFLAISFRGIDYEAVPLTGKGASHDA